MCRVHRTAVSSVLSAVALAATATAQTYSLPSGNAALDFQLDATNGAVITSIQLDGQTEFTLDRESLWRLELWSRTPTGSDPPFDVTKTPVTAADAASFIPALGGATGSGVTMTWSSFAAYPTLTVIVDVDPAPGRPGTFEWRGTVDASTLGAEGVGRLDLPAFTIDDPGASSHLYLGVNGGWRITDPAVGAFTDDQGTPVPLSMMYPDKLILPLAALTDADRDVFLALTTGETGDERFRFRQFEVFGRGAGTAIELSTGDLPDEPFVGAAVVAKTSVLHVQATTHPAAAWHDVALWYRQRLEGNGELSGPGHRGLMSSLSGPEDAALDYDMILTVGNTDPLACDTADYGAYDAYTQELCTELGIDTDRLATIWFDWHNNVQGTDHPSHLPVDDGVGFGVWTTTTDYKISPYMGLLTWGDRHPDFATYNPDQWALVNEVGSQNCKLVTANGPQCPPFGGGPPDYNNYTLDRGVIAATDALFDTLFDPVLDDPHYGLEGFYLDATPVVRRCFSEDPAHGGHPVGGGLSIMNGLRDIFTRLRAKVAEPTFFSEDTHEALVDLSAGSGYYPWENPNAFKVPKANTGMVPLHSAVYGAYQPNVLNNRFIDLTYQVAPGVPVPIAAFLGDPVTFPQSVVDEYTEWAMMTLAWNWAYGLRFSWAHRPAPPEAPPGYPDSILEMENELNGKIYEGFLLFRDLLRTQVEANNRLLVLEGRMATPPKLFGVSLVDPPVSQFSQSDLEPFEDGKVPNVFSAAFLGENGDLAVTFVNWTSSQVLLSWELQETWYGMDLSESWTVTVSQPAEPLASPGAFALTENASSDPVVVGAFFDPESLDIEFPVEPWECFVVRFEKN